ncbi:hypothetical protein PoB_007698700 [Plakobranchus ocellatus]|uniref:CEP170 C-terminal domain-containing protein n=1 Tax=Plakobranchus ocellatus TaxID=259542 RepID=A0AAV4E2I2_9GAST|nr:hypothetical protein PoB_007698700 [Plakobranchus ocellatus]
MELTTVKKGTPLYGQPSWWGEEEEINSACRTGPSGDAPVTKDPRTSREDGTRSSGGKQSRPNSLTLSGDEADASPTSKMSAKNSSGTGVEVGHKRINGERFKPTYMEIPLRDDDDTSKSHDDASGSSGKKTASAANSSATSTPAKSISSSLSKDSLLDSPDARKAPTPKAPTETATSFTVDFSDPNDPQHKPAKAVTMAASLSQYVPSKIRRNFKDRQERAGSYTKAGSSSRGSTPSKTSEERELSPLHQSSSQKQEQLQQQRKLDEIWSVVEGGSKPSSKQASRFSSVQATAGSKSSLRSPNLEDIDRFSEDRAKGQKASSISPQVTRSSRNKPSGSATSKGAGVVAAVAQYPDSTSYLIDKMFEGGSSSGIGGSAASSTVGSESEVSPEKQMYKEAAASDRTRRSTSSTTSGTALGKQMGKPPKTSTGGKSGIDPVSRKHTSAPSNDKTRLSSSTKTKKSEGETLAAAKATQSKRQTAPSPPKICDNDDSDDDKDVVEDDDLQIREDGEILTAQVAEDGEVSDKASEAGTYVIEAGEGEDEEGEEEEEEARRKIDEVFGVDKPHSRMDPLRLASPGGYDNVYDEDSNHNDRTLGAGDELDDMNEGEKTPLDGQSPLSEDDEGMEEPSMATTDGVHTWMSQLNALTSSHRQQALSADDRQMAKEDGETSLSRKPPQGGAKRPGTGRKLPSIPTTDRSPVSSEHSSTCILDPDAAAVVDGQAGWSAASSQRILNGSHRSNGTAGMRGKTSADTPAARNYKSSSAVKNGVSNGSHMRQLSSSSPGSARSRGSVDTELLLQDTETVMAAMEARMAFRTADDAIDRRASRDDGDCDSDTDVSSTVALVNGDEDYVKPSYYKSPRDVLARTTSLNDSRRSGGTASSRATGAVNVAASATQPAKRTVARSYSHTVASKSRTPTSSTASPRTPTLTSVSANVQRRSVGSDVFSGRDSVDADSLTSDLGSESGTLDGSLSRSSSRGKGTITMTKPNRAFQLRRARSDSVEEANAPSTPRSGKTGASARTPGSSARSSSVHSTNRTRSAVDTNRSEATSLGAQIARKSKNNGAVMQADVRTSGATGTQKISSSTNLQRQDGGRHSLRLTRASSLTMSSPAQTASSSATSKKEAMHVSSSSSSKSNVRSTPTGSRGNLAITGVSTSSGGVGSSRSHSQPGSRSNSPKAAERIAWRRRKEYDPRRAVAEAKAAKAKESGTSNGTVTMRPKPHANSRVNRRMIRSASFTNTGGSLALSLSGSVSASQELVSGAPSATDYNGESGGGGSGAFRRAFLPFQAVSGRVGGQSSAHSADEDDSLLGSTRAATARSSPGSLSVTSEPKSAFTPPPLTLHQRPALRRSPGATGHSRPYSGFSRKGSLSLLRRRSLQGELNGYLPLSLPPRSSGDFDDDLTGFNDVGRNHLTNGASGQSKNESPPKSIKKVTPGFHVLFHQARADQSRASHSPSPCDDFLNDGSTSRNQMTAFRSANQELAGVLNNLRRLERHVQVMNSVLFPEDEVPTRLSAGSLPSPSTPSTGVAVSSTTAAGGSRQGKQRYFAEIERIRSELAGFHPIGGVQTGGAALPDNASSEADSPEMAELSEQF